MNKSYSATHSEVYNLAHVVFKYSNRNCELSSSTRAFLVRRSTEVPRSKHCMLASEVDPHKHIMLASRSCCAPNYTVLFAGLHESGLSEKV